MRRFGDDAWAANWNQPTSTSTVDAGGSEIPYYLAANDYQGDIVNHPSTSSDYVSDNSGGNAGSAHPDSSPSARDWFSMGQQTVTGLLNIFGQPVRAPGQPMPVQQPQGMPLWGWAAIGIGGVVLLGVLARSMRGSKVGYRRRRSRR